MVSMSAMNQGQITLGDDGELFTTDNIEIDNSVFAALPDLYLVDANKLSWITGKKNKPVKRIHPSRKRAFKSWRNNLLMIAFWFIFSTLIMWEPANRENQIVSRLKQHGLTTQATIVNKREAKNKSSTYYYVTYQFDPSSSTKLFEREESVDYKMYEDAAQGVLVTITYLPNDPNISRLILQDAVEFRNTLELNMMMWGAGGGFVLLILILGSLSDLYPKWNKIQNERKLRKKAVLLKGKIKSYKYRSKSSKKIEKLNYSFVTPKGRVIIADFPYSPQYRFDKDGRPVGEPAPKIGTPVAILFLDETNYKLL
jgi:hypothetical protein